MNETVVGLGHKFGCDSNRGRLATNSGVIATCLGWDHQIGCDRNRDRLRTTRLFVSATVIC